MDNIRQKEESLMTILKTITITDKDGLAHPVPVIYGTQQKAAAYVTADAKEDGVVDRIRLPLITVVADTVSRRSIGFQGKIYTLYRQDLNHIIEQLFALEEDDRSPLENRRPRISVGTITIDNSEEDDSKKVRVISAKFGLVVES